MERGDCGWAAVAMDRCWTDSLSREQLPFLCNRIEAGEVAHGSGDRSAIQHRYRNRAARDGDREVVRERAGGAADFAVNPAGPASIARAGVDAAGEGDL